MRASKFIPAKSRQSVNPSLYFQTGSNAGRYIFRLNLRKSRRRLLRERARIRRRKHGWR